MTIDDDQWQLMAIKKHSQIFWPLNGHRFPISIDYFFFDCYRLSVSSIDNAGFKGRHTQGEMSERLVAGTSPGICPIIQS